MFPHGRSPNVLAPRIANAASTSLHHARLRTTTDLLGPPKHIAISDADHTNAKKPNRTTISLVDLLSVDSIEEHNRVSGKGFPTTGPRVQAENVVIHRGLHYVVKHWSEGGSWSLDGEGHSFDVYALLLWMFL
uniref:Uncharacterized protein n=1 Tax=Cucumis melo TaxID=3656 RepID=A0A9I9E7S6_CUCME